MAKQIGVGVESTYGTAVTPTDFFEATSETVQDEPNYIDIKTIRSPSIRSVELLSAVVRGQVEAVANYHEGGVLFKHLLGSVDTTSSGSEFRHTFPASTGIPSGERDGLSLTMEVARDDSLVFTYTGMKVTGFSLAASLDAASQYTWSFIGKAVTTGATATSASFPSLDVIIPSEITVSVDGTSQNAQAANINVAYPVDEPFVFGNTALALEPKSSDTLAVTGDFTILFNAFTDYTKFANRSDVDIQLNITDGTNRLTINVDKAKLTQATPHLNERERLQATYTFRGYFSTTAVPGVQIVVVNEDAALP